MKDYSVKRSQERRLIPKRGGYPHFLLQLPDQDELFFRTDPEARDMGEFAIGNNFEIERFTRNFSMKRWAAPPIWPWALASRK
jgi:hypothetical protein